MPEFRLSRNQLLSLTCPQCNQQFYKTIRQMESKAGFTCPKCNLTMKPKDGISPFKDFEKVTNNFSEGFQRTLGKLRK